MTTPRRLSDRYELGEILGVGGMSEVHLARDLRLQRDVAVKLLRADLALEPSRNLRFQREAQNAAALNHSAIAAVYDTGEVETPNGPLPYIVMEYVDGQTLRDVVRRDGPMPAGRAIEVVADACLALNFSHQRGIIHRDIKPANIMIGTAGAIKVVDFGIAKAIAENDDGSGAIMGTAHYLSPEQARGVRVDARADVYSLGCVLYEIATGDPPFIGDSPVAVAYQHVRAEPVAPSGRNGELTADLDAVVLKAMAKNPDNRYQTAADMRADLIRVHRGLPPHALMGRADADGRLAPGTSDPFDRNPPTEQMSTPPSSAGRRHGSSSIRRWLIAAAVLAVLALVGTIGLDAVRGDRRDVTVPDVRGQASAEAMASLKNDGFQTRIRPSANSTVAPGLVIDTEPELNTTVNAGAEITLNVSSGPGENSPVSTDSAQVAVPDVATLTYLEAVSRLTTAGFKTFQQASLPSPPELRDRVVGTNPPANRITATANEITIVMGSGPPNAAP